MASKFLQSLKKKALIYTVCDSWAVQLIIITITIPSSGGLSYKIKSVFNTILSPTVFFSSSGLKSDLKS
jgi:hypothetical protein